ncbi:MAG TPA: HEAT repeat domain-containing protein [Pseudonocardiaceae bacterium]
MATEDDEVVIAGERFRSAAAAHWAAVRAGDASAADRQTEVLDQLASQWADGQGVTDLLAPLLADDEEPTVRGAAAMYLLNRGHADQAVPVLAALADDDEIGLVAEEAELALLMWKRQQGNGGNTGSASANG